MFKKIIFFFVIIVVIAWGSHLFSQDETKSTQIAETSVDYSVESLKKQVISESKKSQQENLKILEAFQKRDQFEDKKSAPITKTEGNVDVANSKESDTKVLFKGIQAPEKLYMIVSDETKISIGWESVQGAEGYNVTRDGKYHATVNEGNVFIDENLEKEKIYVYQVSAYGNDEYSPNSSKFRVKASKGGVDTSKGPDHPMIEDVERTDYILGFFDEFNGTSLDVNKWNTAFLWGAKTTINNEEQYYVDIHGIDQDKAINPFSMNNGSLTIQAKKLPKGLQKQYSNKAYTSGLITSYDAFHFTHGYAEARVKIPQGDGLWPAFWLLNAYYDNGLKKPEIDIMENLGQNTNKVYQTYHYFDKDDKLISTESHVEEYDYASDYHIYSVLWEPGLIQFYIDGVKQNSIKGDQVADEKMYVLLNLAVGGNWPGSPGEATEFPAEYSIDWVRVYNKK